MPLFTNFTAGCTYERHGHGATHSGDLFSVGRLAVGTHDTLTSGKILLLLAGGLTLFGLMLGVETFHFLTMGF